MDPGAALKAFAAVFPAELPDKSMVVTIVLVARYHRPLWVWCGAALAFTLHVALAVVAGSLLTLLPEVAVTLATAGLFAAGALLLWRGAGTAGAGTAGAGTGDDGDEGDEGEPAGDRATSGLEGDDGGIVADQGGGDLRDPGDGPAAPDGAPARATQDSDPGPGAATPAGARGPAGATGASARQAVAGSFGVIAVAEWGDLTQLATAGLAGSTGAPAMVALGAVLALWTVSGLAATAGRGLVGVLPLDRLQRAAAAVFLGLAALTLWTLR